MTFSYVENIFILSIALIFSVICIGYLALIIYEKRAYKRARENIRKTSGIEGDEENQFTCTGVANKVLTYCLKVARSLEFVNGGSSVVGRFIKNKDLNKKLDERRRLSGLPESFDNVAYKETQVRFAVLLGACLMLVGIVLSNLAGAIGLLAGIIVGFILPGWAMKAEIKNKTELVESALPEMLEVLSLCLRSGLTFERSVALYIKHFENELSRAFSLAMSKWNGGIMTREEALKELAGRYDCPQLKRVIDNIIRSLRFGTSLASSLEEAAVESRNAYKTKREEAVAKAPVKMMIPTGTLILPAMLLLVLGPVLLELAGGF